MISTADIPSSIVSLLTESGEFGDILTVEAYENEIKPTPLVKPIAAFSGKGCDIGERLQLVESDGEIVDSLNRLVTVRVSMDIYMPYSMGGGEAHRLFDKITQYLMYTEEQDIISASCGGTEYDKACQSIVLRGVLTYKMIAKP